jgi:hypothetical protein
MIDATDLTTIEVRTQYVQPLIKGILVKTNLCRHAATIFGRQNCAALTPSSEKDNDERVFGTLYQEIALYNKQELGVDGCNSTNEIVKTYAEVMQRMFGKLHKFYTQLTQPMFPSKQIISADT